MGCFGSTQTTSGIKTFFFFFFGNRVVVERRRCSDRTQSEDQIASCQGQVEPSPLDPATTFRPVQPTPPCKVKKRKRRSIDGPQSDVLILVAVSLSLNHHPRALLFAVLVRGSGPSIEAERIPRASKKRPSRFASSAGGSEQGGGVHK